MEISGNEKDKKILEFLKIFLESFNKSNSDALLTFIIFENILRILNISLLEVNDLFTENPNEIFYRFLKHNEIFSINENFNILSSPEKLQYDVDIFLKELGDKNAKCFFKKIKNCRTSHTLLA